VPQTSAPKIDAVNAFISPEDRLPEAMSLFDVFEVCWAMEDGLMLKDRWHYLRKYPKCILGSDATDWIVANTPIAHTVNDPGHKREVAVAMCQLMVEANLIRHCGPGTVETIKFLDKHQFYRFVGEQERAREQLEHNSAREMVKCAPDTPLNMLNGFLQGADFSMRVLQEVDGTDPRAYTAQFEVRNYSALASFVPLLTMPSSGRLGVSV
jgi:hypothetical protein